MTTMDSDSESQDSDDGRRFRFEATRKDNVHPEAKLGKHSRSKSDCKSSYNDAEYRDRKEKSKHDSSRREHRSSKEQDATDRDLKHSGKYSKHSHESRSSRREDGKDYRSTRDVSIDSKSSAVSSKRKTRDAKRYRDQDRGEHRKHRSQERSHSRTEDDRSQNDKYRNKSHEKYKRHSRDRSRDRSYQSHKPRSSDHGRFRGELERHNSHKRAKEDADQRLQELSSPKNAEQGRTDNELLTKRNLSMESQEYKELDLSEFDVLSETDENLSDGSDVGNKCSLSRHHKAKTKKRNSNDECENSTKKQAIESEHSEGSPKVNERKNDMSSGSSNNNPGAVSDSALGSASPILTEITEDSTNIVDERCKPELMNLNSEEGNFSSTEKASLRVSNCDSPKVTDVSAVEEDSSYGPSLPPPLIADSSSNAKPVKATNFIGPCLPEIDAQDLTERSDVDTTSGNDQIVLSREDSDGDADITFGPALPPHLIQQACSDETKTKIIGPALSNFAKFEDNKETEQAESENEDAIGPLPVDHPALRTSNVYKQLEQRAQQIKNEKKDEDDSTLNQREEWMTELPPAQVSNLGLAPRKFRVRAGPDMSDRSCWTDTPAKRAEKQRQREEEVLNNLKKPPTEPTKESNETESGKSRKREKSLLEVHQSKLEKKKKKEEKKAKLTGQTIRRPFDRDIDLQINRFDQAQKNAVISKAQYLDERFSRGKI
ncbi:serine/threonine-protein kinase prpf4B [Hylaeus volcanicus]|uniref:serine/threonine-protein kinase prpf4B n=1 Tax=Hylaeus volcanicus TaxID=313075 RepID=UPI0023B79576|nr:serine/threonine-protein kinase prpf4B [Hylaeus volcanicus]XP_053980295.1 serine/threonine-protein kinase prpf4B [Hylaeus volcanicus]